MLRYETRDQGWEDRQVRPQKPHGDNKQRRSDVVFVFVLTKTQKRQTLHLLYCKLSCQRRVESDSRITFDCVI
jgi:hypothetical protein